MIDRIMRVWTWVETVAIGCLILAALAIFLGGAVVRAVAPLYAVDWAEEIALYCIIWATVLSGSSLVAEGRHIRTEIVLVAMPPRLRRATGWFVVAATTAFAAAMAVFGWQAMDFALLLDERSASTLRTPQAWAVFLALPVGMILILGRVALMLIQGDRPFDDDPDTVRRKAS